MWLFSHCSPLTVEDVLFWICFQVGTAVIMKASFAFVLVSVAYLFHEGGGRQKLMWFGGITQAGACCGAVVAFILVSYFEIFKSQSLCSLP